MIFDRHSYGWRDLGTDAWGAYPAEELTATGVIAGRSVHCKTPALEVRHRLGYPLSATDRHDLALLARRFGVPYLQVLPTWLPASLVLDRIGPGVVFRWLVGARRASGPLPPGRLSAPSLGGGQPQAQQAAGDQADRRPGLVPGLQRGDQHADDGADHRQAEHEHDPYGCAPPCPWRRLAWAPPRSGWAMFQAAAATPASGFVRKHLRARWL